MNGKKSRMMKINTMYYRVIKLILLVLIGVILVQLILPINGVGGNYTKVLVMNVLFYGIILEILAIKGLRYTYLVGFISNANKNIITGMQYKKLRFLITFCAVIALIGFVMLLYDRIIIRGIDYSMGLRASRYIWAKTSGSWISKTGNIFIAQGYVGACVSFWFLLVAKTKKIKKKLIVGLIICSVIIFLHAVLNGGRSNIYVLIALISGVIIINYNKTKPRNLSNKNQTRLLCLFIIGIICALIYSMLIFRSSINMGGVSVQYYAKTVIENLKGEITSPLDWLRNSNQFMYEIFLLFILAVSYIIHGQWVANISLGLASSERVGFISFSAINHLMYNCGIVNSPPDLYLFTGIFITLPGSLYYDFGYLGVIIGAIVLGMLINIVLKKVVKHKINSAFELGICLYLIAIFFTSFVFPLYNFTYSLFVLPSFLITGILADLFYGKSSWINLER